MRSVVIASLVRTPIGRAGKGSLRDMRPDDLVAGAIGRAVTNSGLAPDLLDDHVLGTGYPEGRQGSNLEGCGGVNCSAGALVRGAGRAAHGGCMAVREGTGKSAGEVSTSRRGRNLLAH
ncbi:hypothetical protein [Streptomyces sp. NPDC051214]|uniref:thiolase family protein n=1 Tax=Streptomyces sp. NPDC051214 TaxID=3155282 RepID=UPI003442CAD0